MKIKMLPTGNEGFTLTEILVVMVVISVLSGFAIFQFQPETGRMETVELVAMLHRVRLEAITTQKMQAIDLSAHNYLPTFPGAYIDDEHTLFFLPDGTASGGVLRLEGATIEINWLTGAIHHDHH